MSSIGENRISWCARTDSNRQPSDPKSDALSIELRTLVHYILVVLWDYWLERITHDDVLHLVEECVACKCPTTFFIPPLLVVGVEKNLVITEFA